jgi:heat shock protein HslJ
VHTDTLFLGDRVRVHSLEVENNEIVIAMTTHSLDDAMCCPTIEVKKRFAVQGNRLVISAEEAMAGESQITRTVWQWRQTLYNDDRKVVPPDPENYTVQFQDAGTLNVKADCNQKGGTYTYSPQERRLSVEITHSTMASCPEGSLEDEFVRGLSAAAIYFIKEGDLYIDLMYDTGTMRFSEQKEN